MSLSKVTVKEIVSDWTANPKGLLAWILELIWEAGISPDDSITWLAKDKKITIQIWNSIIEEEQS